MATNWFSLILATVLALSVVSLEAKSLENRYRHMRDISSENSGGESSRTSLNLKYHVPRRENQKERRRRGFAQWNAPHEHYQRLSRWQPSASTINRPYLIPVFGPAGCIPIYFPPQPLNSNVGFPPDNPNIFMAPTYLPPKVTTVKPQTTTTKKIDNRFLFDDDGEERPVWGESVQTQRPKGSTSQPRPQQSAPRPQQRPARPQQNTIIPTRPPRPPSTETPPLVHQSNDGKIPVNTNDISEDTAMALEEIFGSAEDYTPIKESRPIQSSSSVLKTTTIRPRTTTVSTSTTPKEGDSVPSNCVWAVVSCCSAASTKVMESCFEQRGCPGPFWDRSPCDSDFAKAAINKALEYYG